MRPVCGPSVLPSRPWVGTGDGGLDGSEVRGGVLIWKPRTGMVRSRSGRGPILNPPTTPPVDSGLSPGYFDENGPDALPVLRDYGASESI